MSERRCRRGESNLHKRNPIIKHHATKNWKLFSRRSPIMDSFWRYDVLKSVLILLLCSWKKQQRSGVHCRFMTDSPKKRRNYASKDKFLMKHIACVSLHLTDNNFSWLNHKRMRRILLRIHQICLFGGAHETGTLCDNIKTTISTFHIFQPLLNSIKVKFIIPFACYCCFQLI